jgi:hypothetical protein
LKIPDGPGTVNRSDNTREKTRKKEEKSNNGPQKTWDELRPHDSKMYSSYQLKCQWFVWKQNQYGSKQNKNYPMPSTHI